MYDRNTFDVQKAEPQVQTAMAQLIFAYVHGGVGGGISAAVDTFRKQLERLGYSPDYIEAASQHCNALGDEGWRKKNGIR